MSEIENVLKVFLEYAANTTSEARLDVDMYQGNIQTLSVTVMEPREEAKESNEDPNTTSFYDPVTDYHFKCLDKEIEETKNRVKKQLGISE